MTTERNGALHSHDIPPYVPHRCVVSIASNDVRWACSLAWIGRMIVNDGQDNNLDATERHFGPGSCTV